MLERESQGKGKLRDKCSMLMFIFTGQLQWDTFGCTGMMLYPQRNPARAINGTSFEGSITPSGYTLGDFRPVI